MEHEERTIGILSPEKTFSRPFCQRQEVTHNVGQRERYEGFLEGNLSLQYTGSPMRPGPLLLQ